MDKNLIQKIPALRKTIYQAKDMIIKAGKILFHPRKKNTINTTMANIILYHVKTANDR